MFKLGEIRGKTILEIKGRRDNWGRVTPIIIFFDDSETFILLKEQNYYDWHDSDTSARLIKVHQNILEWQKYWKDENLFLANEDIW